MSPLVWLWGCAAVTGFAPIRGPTSRPCLRMGALVCHRSITGQVGTSASETCVWPNGSAAKAESEAGIALTGVDDIAVDNVLSLRPLRGGDEREVREAHRVMESEDFAFAPGLTAETAWDAYCACLQQQRAGIGLPSGWVPSTFLVAEAGGRIVGRSSIRHRLTEQLAQVGGHIGFCAADLSPTRIRHRDPAAEPSSGASSACPMCSSRVTSPTSDRKKIESCGGVLVAVVSVVPGSRIRRYRIG